MAAALVAGAMLGLSVALPLGPVSLLCVQRSIAIGHRCGLTTGLGAASAHGIFAAVAVVGAGELAAYLSHWSRLIRVASAAVLVVLGLRVLLRPATASGVSVISMHATYTSGLLLALSNPMTVLPYIAVASGAAVTGTTGLAFSPWSVPGVMMGAAAWYATLSTITAMIRGGIPICITHYLRPTSGLALVSFGLLLGLC